VSEYLGPPILVVDDSPEDYETTVRAFRRAGLRNPMHHCTTGDEALDFLHQRGPFEGADHAPRPAIILLDLNLPGTDGRTVLQEIKRAQELSRIPVVVLTTSTDRRDVDACYEAGANSYVHKPVDLEAFMKAIQLLSEYWFDVVILPKDA
jgi:two-component system, response regulator